MRTAPWRTSAGHCTPGCAGLLVLALGAMLAGGCVPEHVQQHYAMSAAAKPRPGEQRRAAAQRRRAEPEQPARAEPMPPAHEPRQAEQTPPVDKIGAAKVIPVPNRALLAPAGAPACGSSAIATASNAEPRGEQPGTGGKRPVTAQASASAAPSPTSAASAGNHAPSELEVRIALEYERACYKQAEARVRAQLQELQQSLAESIKAAEDRKSEEHPAARN